MRVVLAGFNTDRQFSSETPETISAAYARISRDPRPVWDLREEAARETANARKSNSRIVFGFGHSSVAEHAVFNLDIGGISRFAAEALQSFRLASFMEKSQRYIRMEGDWIVPEGLPEGMSGVFESTCRELFGLYGGILEALEATGVPAASAREDARYVLPLATACQMGMTANARELEHIMRRLRAWPVPEVAALAGAISDAVEPAAPSLFRHTTPVEMDSFAARSALSPRGVPRRAVSLVDGDGDAAVGIRLIAERDGLTHGRARSAWRAMEGPERELLFEDFRDRLGVHDALPRIWEMARFTFEISASSTAFAQLKRHRMATISASAPYPGSGIVVPPSFAGTRAGRLLARGMAASESLASALPVPLRPYALLNAHRRAVIVSMNARELVHFSRLREDSHAQWDIRGISGRMLELAGRRAPLTLSMSGGKSDFGN